MDSKLIFWIDIAPIGAVRMTQRGKWVSDKAQRYLAYKEQIAWQIKARMRDLKTEPIMSACTVKVIFHMPMPKSWSDKKKMAMIGHYHTSKPDIDNLVKGLFDAANGIVWKDDSQVVEVKAEKGYRNEPGIWLEVIELF